ncbi:hypothetical protein EV359DRAFT_68112 [Lentinula novae-zelandiae]|nr:hypothetical protein EV359DRAFT_68112 [Lentinula novae-zelandiae]
MSNMSDPPINWQPDPDFRGTFNLVSTLRFTLTSRVTRGNAVDCGVRVGWISVGLVTPETLLFIAYRQWTIAGEIFAVANPFEASTKPWHRLFLQLKEYLKWGGPQDSGYGENRSKANGLSKSVVVVQVTFFLVNCIARKIQRLPVTLLEVTTVAHTLCSLLAYAFWWNKPLSVSHPTLIRGEVAMRTCALMYYFLAGYLMVWRPAELDSLCCHEIESLDAEKCPASNRDSTKHWQQIYFTPYPPRYPPERWSIGKRYLGPQPWYREWQNNVHDRESAPGAAPNLTRSDKRRWALAASAPWKLLQDLEKPHVEYLSTTLTREMYSATQMPWCPQTPAYPLPLKSRGGNPRKITLNDDDPRTVRCPNSCIVIRIPQSHCMFLWRGAALAATFRGTVYWGTRGLGLYITHRMNNYFLRKAAAVIPVCLLMGMLVPSSIILVAESFKQLLYLPGAAYYLPILVLYVPIVEKNNSIIMYKNYW